MAYVAAAYLAAGLLVIGYIWTLRIRQRDIARTMQRPKGS